MDFDILEITAVIFGLLSVWYAKKENILVFPTGIVSVLIYVYICYNYKLYADMGINAYYFIMSIYGWVFWTSKSNSAQKTRPISYLSKNETWFSFCLLLAFFILLSYVLSTYTDSDVPYIDSLTTAIAFVAMLLMARKKIENWILWILTDIISIPLYLYKDLLFTSIQFFIFTIIAIMGYFEWVKSIKTQQKLK